MSELLGRLQTATFARATAATASSYPPERRLSAAQLASYLDRRAFAVVGSTRDDGRPHAALSSYVRRGTRPRVTGWRPGSGWRPSACSPMRRTARRPERQVS